MTRLSGEGIEAILQAIQEFKDDQRLLIKSSMYWLRSRFGVRPLDKCGNQCGDTKYTFETDPV